jgi:hypothetical protein
MLRRLTAAVALGATLTACGSTVPLSQQQSSLQGDGLNGGTTGSADGTTSGSGDGSTTGVVDGSTGGSTSGGSTGALGTTGSSSSGGGSATGSTGLGTTSTTGTLIKGKKPIDVGFTYVKDAAAGFQAFGIQGATLGDMQLYIKTYVDDANRRGGLAGRKIVPHYFAYDVNPGSASYPEQDAQACAALTQDVKVEVAVPIFAGDVLVQCLQKKGIPMIADGPTGGISEASLKRFSNEVVLGGFNLDRRARETVRNLVRQQYFATKWDTTNGGPGGVAAVKVGIITYDLPDWTHSANQLAASVAAAGFGTPKVVAVAAHDSYGDISKMQPQISNAVLSFRTAGITHVIIWDDNGVSSLFFMQNAENQKYRPRYGITSGNNMQLLSKGLVSKNQLTGATGMGWVPAMDIADAKSPTSAYANSARRACYAIVKKAGVAGGSGFNETSSMMYCAPITALKDRWDRMANPSASGLIAALNAYGTGFVDPQVPATFLSGSHHDGNAGVYDYYYDSPCSCMKYRGGVQPLAR